ncbi:hypothetical protein E2C01_021170 [Portunus trituberculatus]|uniref:Uncharacterized protein n=1 Tax=Portunus trituberculatus TaxID=210409 RepID=A0A5B7E3Q3_PORTR|nr:hypothetical protein [Portunus trituberculatus]
MEKRKTERRSEGLCKGAANQSERTRELGKIIRKKTRSDNAARPPLVVFWAGQKTRSPVTKG